MTQSLIKKSRLSTAFSPVTCRGDAKGKAGSPASPRTKGGRFSFYKNLGYLSILRDIKSRVN